MVRSAIRGRLAVAGGALAVLLWGCGGADDPDAISGDAGGEQDSAPAGPALGSACANAGELACQGVGQKLQLLCDGTKWVSNGVCAGDLVCDSRPGATIGSCQSPPPACASTAAICDGSALLKCGADRLSVERVDCATPEHCKQAVGGLCAQCLAWEVKCDGAELKKCAGDRQSMVTKEVCASAGLCNETAGACKEPVCEPGAHRCNGDVLEACKADRSGYDGLATCGAGFCDATLKVCRECTAAAKGCVGAIPRVCDSSGKWISLPACSGTTPVCSDGLCVAATCATGEHRCRGDILEQCNSSRTGFDSVRACGAGLCDAVEKECNECAPGSAECVGSTPRACDSSGRWKTLTACSGSTPVCKSGVCTAFCLSGEHRCSGDTLEKCNSTGTAFETVKTCSVGLCDAAGKECDECKPGEKSCSGTIPRLCDSTGHWTSMTACSGSTPYCDAGSCAATASKTYTASFTASTFYGPTSSQCTSWNAFRASLTGGTYSKITISGTFDPTGITCTGTSADTLCRALATGTPASVVCGGSAGWRVGTCGDPSSIEITTSISTCGCTGGGNSVRPCVNTKDWGGVKTDTCAPPTQTMTVRCE